MIPRWALSGSVLVQVALVAGCPSPPPAPRVRIEHAGPPIEFSSPRELIRRTLARNDGYRTLTTVHRVALEIAVSAKHSEKRSFRGALALRRPGHLRLQILGPMGVKVADLLHEQGRTRVLSVDRTLERSSRLSALLESIAGDIRAIYRLDSNPDVDRRRVEETVTLASRSAPLFNLREYRAGKLVRQMDIFAATLAIARVQMLRGDNVLTITYGDYETDGNILIPRQIHVAREGPVFYWLSIRVESIELDPSLDKRIFVADGT